VTELHWTEIGGVPTVWADAPSPMRAGLLFRTGVADETLATVGVTHLIEHIALSSIDDPMRRNNGFVSPQTTGFLTIGTADEVCAFINQICRNLSDLSGDRLEVEKQVLEAESSSRSFDPRRDLLCERFGARGFGLLDMQELGLRGATIDSLHEWSRRVFTKGNAVLWMSGEPPTGLKLDLPDGERQPIPALDTVLVDFPCWTAEKSDRGIVSASLIPRNSAATVLCHITDKRLNAGLREEHAVSYNPFVSYEPLDAEVAHFCMLAESDPSRRRELAEAFEVVVEGLAQIDEEEIESAKAEILEHMVGTLAPQPGDEALMDVQGAANDWIHGRDNGTLRQQAAELRDVTLGDVQESVRHLQESMVVALPSAAIVRPWVGRQTRNAEKPLVEGAEIMCVDAPIQRERLRYGSAGVSIRTSLQSHTTVLFNELQAALRHDDGALFLVSADGTSIALEPALWRQGDEVLREISRHIPDSKFVDMGAREKNDIPRPKTRPWQRVTARSQTFLGYTIVGLATIGWLGVLGFLVPLAFFEIIDSQSDPIDFVASAFLVLLPSALLALFTHVGLRMLNDGKRTTALPDEGAPGGCADWATGPRRDEPGCLCTDPLDASLSGAKLAALHPELKPGSLSAMLDALKGKASVAARLRDHLELGDSQAAVVVSVRPLVVGAYSDDVDTVALLTYPDHFAQRYGLEVGSRLITLNTFLRPNAPDLIHGRKALGVWGDFVPLIAEFLTDDAEKIEARKQQIPESEWKRIQGIAVAEFERPAVVRDGHPIPSYQLADERLKAERRS